MDAPEKPTRPRFRLAIFIAIVAGPWILFSFFYWVTPRPEDIRPPEIPATGPIAIAAAGDTLIVNPIADLARDTGAAAVRDAIAGAQFAVASLELNLLGAEEERAAAARPAPRWPFGTAREAAALKLWGFDALALANDHATDYGADGALSTTRILNAAALLHAGTGANLEQARSATFAGLPPRIALLSVSTSSLPVSRATTAPANVEGRPGLNPLRYTAAITVDAATFETLEKSETARNAVPPPGNRELTVFDTTITKGDRTSVAFTVDENDEREILDQIKAARASAEIVVVSLHSHEPSNASETPAEFVQRFARRAIDAGAALVVGHGPHRLRGVELYKTGAILYSLGNFMYQADGLDFRAANFYDGGADLYETTVGARPAAAQGSTSPPDDSSWWLSAVALVTVDRGGVLELRLLPVDLGTDRPTKERGIPRRANGALAEQILTRIARLSSPFGTTIQITDSTGLARSSTPVK